MDSRDVHSRIIGGIVLAGIILPVLAASPGAAATSYAGWGDPRLLETVDAGNAGHPVVAVDGAGNAVAVWVQSDGINSNAMSSHFSPLSGWSPAQEIEQHDGSAGFPALAANGAGVAFAAWDASSGGRADIFANRYEPGSGWGLAGLIETDDSGTAFSPSVAVDAGGNATVVWRQFTGGIFRLWANRYSAAGGWGTATSVAPSVVGHADGTKVAVDPQGNAVAVWHQGGDVWTSRWTPVSGWENASALENGSQAGFDAELAIGPQGDVTAVWLVHDGAQSSVWSNRWTPQTSWGNATLIEFNSSGSAFAPQVAADPMGNVMVTWYQFDGSNSNAWANRYTPGGGWGNATLVEMYPGSAYEPRIAIDARGAATVVWSQDEGPVNSAVVNRYVPGVGWGNASRLEYDNLQIATSPEVAVAPSGDGIAVWLQSGATVDVWTARFIDPRPPILVLFAPSEADTTANSSIWVEGSTEPDATVVVNGHMAGVGPTGDFGLRIPLSAGPNRVVVAAIDPTGSSTTAVVNVTFVDPAGALGQELAAVRANLSLALMEIQTLSDELTSTRAEANASAQQLSSLRAQHNATSDELEEANAQIGQHRATLAAAMGTLSLLLAVTLASLALSIAAMLLLVRSGRMPKRPA